MRVKLELGLVLALGATLAIHTNATALRGQGQTPERGCTQKLANVVHSAVDICGDLPVEQALRTLTMPPEPARKAGALLLKLGFRTALDLELLGGGEAAAEVLDELKAGGLSPGDRAKLRLLVGDQAHLRRLASLSSPSPERSTVASSSVDYGPASSSPSDFGEHDASTDGRDSSTTASSMSRRVLQHDSEADGGVSADTIAVVLSVLVGAGGYVLQAHTARRAQAAEQGRQREHQMMTAQIDRTSQALDLCCRPVLNDLAAIASARYCFIQQIVDRLKVSHPAAVEQMQSLSSIGKILPDGSLCSATSGRVYWTPVSASELTRTMSSMAGQPPSAIASLIGTEDYFTLWSNAYCADMPNAVLDIILAEPTGEIAKMYRGYVRDTMMPLYRRVADRLQSYAAYVEFPQKEWLQETYPEEAWNNYSNTAFVSHWYSYTSSLERILEEWSDGNFTSTGPGSGQPLGGLMQTLMWSQEQAQEKQAELIGMTATAEIDHESVFARMNKGNGVASFEMDQIMTDEKASDVAGNASFDMPLATR